MNLQTGKLYWPTTFPDAPSYPPLDEDIQCDVLIVGAGGSGALCAYYLSETDLDVVVIDKRKAGYGSTMTNTALIQCLGDKMFFELVNSFGETYAARHLTLCQQAVNELERTANQLHIDTEFKRRDSLYYASVAEDVAKLEKEYEALKKQGYPVVWLNEQQIRQHYPFKKHAALYTTGDGELNPYKLTIGLLEYAKKRGVRVFEETEMNGKKLEQHMATCYTKNGYSIRARKVIFAAGYETLEVKQEKKALLVSSYAVITNRIEDFSSWYKRTLIWETARPYVYMRTTADNRIIIGGLDENTAYADDRDAKLMHKKERLIEEFHRLFPNIHVVPEFYLAAFYGGTHDGLPMIGVYDSFPNCYFVYAYGDNGTVYSTVLAQILRDVITEKQNDDFYLYMQTRPKLPQT
ncbi:NAD(P)/FAD-dependent oxidoreductase [Anoxybacillus suryakundensis]|uniref:Glycine/D-amino acid oxidase (Deaminating) n=1 Tax=Anoxybacillus suryakundensis TaxID=1325335 RepID=A0A0K6GNW6_9BACL|nr:FAD-dependent oxidoreductase [Anoxybacillus suryakundensis]CUA80236.1 Glycine/D-amino acid oxidase (deaminating) [Anoxybacillus suryakundensis]